MLMLYILVCLLRWSFSAKRKIGNHFIGDDSHILRIIRGAGVCFQGLRTLPNPTWSDIREEGEYTTQILHLYLLCPGYQPLVASYSQPSIQGISNTGDVMEKPNKDGSIMAK